MVCALRSAVQYVRTCGIICDHLSICNAYCNCVMCTVCVTLYIYIGYVNICFTVLHSTYSFPTPYHLCTYVGEGRATEPTM